MSKAAKSIAKVITGTVGGELFGLGASQEKDASTPAVEAPPTAPTAVGEETQAAREALRKRQLAAAGLGGTMLTGVGGLGSASTAGKSLLGS